ncbi:MAG: selenide, water dikinase SelD, partial [Armatimonadetes bacterium]|nr:selenide, water dikinase SelD [Armatimonadota bacterium]
EDELAEAVRWMEKLNREASEVALAHGVRCATDVTGFGLCGHLFNVARASGVGIEIVAEALPVLPGVERMVAEGNTTGGAGANELHLADRLDVAPTVPPWLKAVALDPQTSGGLALFSPDPIPGFAEIGRVVEGEPHIRLV